MQGIILRDTNHPQGGIINLKGEQKAFDISQWRSQYAPKVNDLVEVKLTNNGDIITVTKVEIDNLTEQKLSNAPTTLTTKDALHYLAENKLSIPTKDGAIYLEVSQVNPARRQLNLSCIAMAIVIFLCWYFVPITNYKLTFFSFFNNIEPVGLWAALSICTLILPIILKFFKAPLATLTFLAPFILTFYTFDEVINQKLEKIIGSHVSDSSTNSSWFSSSLNTITDLSNRVSNAYTGISELTTLYYFSIFCILLLEFVYFIIGVFNRNKY